MTATPPVKAERLPASHDLPKHIPALDGLRGIAILAVMQHHFIPPGSAQGPESHLVFRVLDTGWWGVDLFFVLSGFLITGILYDARGSRHYYRNFYMRRFLRIFPLYYGVLALLFLVLPLLARLPSTSALLGLHPDTFKTLFGDLAQKQAWLWLYAANIKISLDGNWFSLAFLNHLWSLAVEEHFYLVWPVVVLCFRRQALIFVCLAVVAFALAARAVCAWKAYPFVVAFTLTPCRFDALAIGGLAALLVRGSAGVAGLQPYARKLLLVTLPLVAALLLCFDRSSATMMVPGYTLLAVFFAACLLWAIGAGATTQAVLGGRLLGTFGKYSYALYVFHYILVGPFEKLFPRAALTRITGSALAGAFAHALLCTLASLLLALASWHLYEKHFLRFNRYFRERASSLPPPPAAGPLIHPAP
ncbi:MAG: hypothetical protein QOE70_5097 [Chthoniobacter sp.]|jgi:peptidoglycan/LPS O-acetylase OafA/YrhL|nr:hypothetical protein [Chthoniobacter sp.]